MYEKLLIANQSLMLIIAIVLIVMLYQTNSDMRINELETRQTNHLVYLEQKVNNVDARLDSSVNKLDHRLSVIEAKQSY